MFKHVNNFIFYKVNSQFKAVNVVILCNDCDFYLEIICNNFKKVCSKWNSVIYVIKKNQDINLNVLQKELNLFDTFA